MFDFRYHAVSLVAVLIALLVGVLLGVAIGDAGLVSSAENSIRDSLRGDVRSAQARVRETRAELRAEQRYSRAAYPLLVGGRLTGKNVGLIFLGAPSESIAADVRAALQGSGARLAGTLAVRRPPDLSALARGATGTRYETLDEDPTLLPEFGQRIGLQLVLGGALVRREARALFSTRNGGLGPFDAVVVYRNDPQVKDDALANTLALESGIVEGMTTTGIPVVGVQRTTTDPSQIGWYRDHDLSTVDDIDLIAGRAALVFALAGADGSFGVGGDGSLLPGPEAVGF